MLDNIFKELVQEARLGVVKLEVDGDILPAYVSFNIVEDDNISNKMPNIYINDRKKFNKILREYIKTALKFHQMEPTEANIKRLMMYAIVNITEKEMTSLDDYLLKYIRFYNNKFKVVSGEKDSCIGVIKYGVQPQNYKQETPICFKAYFERDNSRYSLPRISFGIKKDTCYVYAIQNKDTKINTDADYNTKVKNELRKLNSGVSKYRNVTPSFVVALVLFISFLRENGINKISVESPLPIRQANRETSANKRIQVYSMKGNLTEDEIEKFKQEITDKRLMDDYNSTVKFKNCFNRLKLHFDNLFLSEINNEMLLDVADIALNNEFLGELIKEKEIDNNGKISKHSSR